MDNFLERLNREIVMAGGNIGDGQELIHLGQIGTPNRKPCDQP